MVISWKIPRNSYGEILGYVVQLRDDNGTCVRETIINCTDCTGKLVSGIQAKCNSVLEPVLHSHI